MVSLQGLTMAYKNSPKITSTSIVNMLLITFWSVHWNWGLKSTSAALEAVCASPESLRMIWPAQYVKSHTLISARRHKTNFTTYWYFCDSRLCSRIPNSSNSCSIMYGMNQTWIWLRICWMAVSFSDYWIHMSKLMARNNITNLENLEMTYSLP